MAVKKEILVQSSMRRLNMEAAARLLFRGQSMAAFEEVEEITKEIRRRLEEVRKDTAKIYKI